MRCPRSLKVVTWTTTRAFRLELIAYVGDAGHRIPSVYWVPKKTWLIFGIHFAVYRTTLLSLTNKSQNTEILWNRLKCEHEEYSRFNLALDPGVELPFLDPQLLRGQKGQANEVMSSVWCMFAHNSTTKSRRKIKIGRKVFRTSSKVKRSKVEVTRPLNAVTESHPYLRSGKVYELSIQMEYLVRMEHVDPHLTYAVTSKLKSLGGWSSHHMQEPEAFLAAVLQAAPLVDSWSTLQFGLLWLPVFQHNVNQSSEIFIVA